MQALANNTMMRNSKNFFNLISYGERRRGRRGQHRGYRRGGRGRGREGQGSERNYAGSRIQKINNSIGIFFLSMLFIEELKKATAPVEIKLVRAPSMTSAEIAKEFDVPVFLIDINCIGN